jgi:hypothetical protein
MKLAEIQDSSQVGDIQSNDGGNILLGRETGP